MSIVTAKLWTIEDVADYIGLSSNEDAWAAVKDLGIPFISYTKEAPDLTKKGARKVRFRPEAVMEWAKGREMVWGEAIPVEAPAATVAGPSKSAGEGDWRTIMGPSKRKGPRKV